MVHWHLNIHQSGLHVFILQRKGGTGLHVLILQRKGGTGLHVFILQRKGGTGLHVFILQRKGGKKTVARVMSTDLFRCVEH